MFDYSLAHWATFMTAAVLLSLSPGPDMTYILAHTARNGQRAGFAAMFGIWSGALIHVVLAAAGLSAILANSATAFLIIKWIGAAYLIWLGTQALLSASGAAPDKTGVTQASHFSIYRQGVLVATLNPKVALFFLAFLPQFVVPGAGPVSAQLLLHGVLVIVAAAFVEPPMVLLGARLARRFQHQAKLSIWFDRGLGAVLIGLGVRLAFAERG